MPDTCIFDLRSPQEFADGSIPGALNLPIFDNEQRAEIGTLYKQIGAETAKTRGLEIASAKLPAMIQSIKAVAGKRNVIVYCWRGGMRSRSIATILHLMGVPVYQLADGYKAYRRYVLQKLENYQILFRFVVLHGLTGVGKTDLLKELAGRGLAVIDLEGLANHRGSVFGHVGKGQPVSAKNFDALLLAALDTYQTARFVFVEAESKRIGNVYLPDCTVKAMQQGVHILVGASLQTRVRRLLNEYLYKDLKLYAEADIVRSLDALKTRLGKNKVAKLKEMLCREDYAAFVEVLLRDYYDPLYSYSEQDAHKFALHVSSENIREAADGIMKYFF